MKVPKYIKGALEKNREYSLRAGHHMNVVYEWLTKNNIPIELDDDIVAMCVNASDGFDGEYLLKFLDNL